MHLVGLKEITLFKRITFNRSVQNIHMVDLNKLPDEKINIDNKIWVREDNFINEGSVMWSRPLHYDERNWNRHDIEVQGTANFPTVSIELTEHSSNEYGVRVLVTQGPDNSDIIGEGMSGVIEGTTTTESIDKAYKLIMNYVEKYNEYNEM